MLHQFYRVLTIITRGSNNSDKAFKCSTFSYSLQMTRAHELVPTYLSHLIPLPPHSCTRAGQVLPFIMTTNLPVLLLRKLIPTLPSWLFLIFQFSFITSSESGVLTQNMIPQYMSSEHPSLFHFIRHDL